MICNNIIGSDNKISLEVKQKWFYQPKSSLAIRLFVGVSPFKHPTVASGFSLYGTHFSDYKYSDITRFRNGNPQYVTEREGGFKNYNVSIFEKFDYSESIIATNLTFQLPKRFRFIQPYFDFAILGGVIGTPEFHWATGVSLGYKDYFNVYFPIAGSNTVAGDYKKQISFSVNLIKLDPWNVNYKKLLMKMIN